MLKNVIVVTAAAVLCSVPVAAKSGRDHQTAMTTEEIRETAVGRTTFGTFADRPLSYAVYVAPDGRLIGKLTDGITERIETGTWTIANDRLIGQWDELKDGEANAFSYVRVGSNVHAVREDGSLDRVQFFVDGDPLGLANAADRTEASVREFLSAWSKAWSPGDGAAAWSYDRNVAPLYADNVLAFDLTEDRTVISGKPDHRSIWEPFVRGFESWRFTILPESVDVSLSGDFAFVTLFVDNEGLRADGERVFFPAQATLFLKHADRGWIIQHEHISVPRRE